MNRFYLMFVFLFIVAKSFAQEKKEIFYLVSEKQILTEQTYKTLDQRKIFTKTVENDSTIVTEIFPRKNTAQLDSTQHQQIKMFLSKIIGKDYNPEKNTMLHLYSDNTEKVKNDLKHKKYWRYIRKNKRKIQAFLIGTKNSGIQANPKKHLYHDPYNLLHNLFFKDSEFKMNHLCIKPNGEVLIFYGLESNLHALDWSV
ncbi:hypothetical protein [Haloflavibacter putidus]|uniref:Uncharacterized protein n=1 Tax=Haloflavibacter putidus TaxID=2576776 RepID=A0A507ZS03_9FLAO|nr:hypothetical protein [Haloflavibacter putidus]TQD39787.1 hypothetical protein FKR84_04665 [Haloflavibacter putidus]